MKLKKELNKGIRIFLFVLFLSIVATTLQNLNVNGSFILILVSISAIFYYSILRFKDVDFFLKASKSEGIIRTRSEALTFSWEYMHTVGSFRGKPVAYYKIISENANIAFDEPVAIEVILAPVQEKELSLGDNTDKFFDLEPSEPSLGFATI